MGVWRAYQQTPTFLIRFTLSSWNEFVLRYIWYFYNLENSPPCGLVFNGQKDPISQEFGFIRLNQTSRLNLAVPQMRLFWDELNFPEKCFCVCRALPSLGRSKTSGWADGGRRNRFNNFAGFGIFSGEYWRKYFHKVPTILQKYGNSLQGWRTDSFVKIKL